MKAVVGGTTTNLVYDPLGRLYQVDQGTNSSITRFLNDGDAMVLEFSHLNEVKNRFVHGSNAAADDPLVWYSGLGLTNKRWLHADHLGSIVAFTNSSGGSPTINKYDEYGAPATGNSGRFQYTGQAWIGELSLYYYKARFYDPRLGRFMQVDPVGYQAGLNLYVYVANDPGNLTDATGLICTGSRIETACGEGAIASGLSGFSTMTPVEHAAGQRAADIQAALRTCSTPSPHDLCGMVQDRTPQALETMMILAKDPTFKEYVKSALLQTGFFGGDKKNEVGFWGTVHNRRFVFVEWRGGIGNQAEFYPVPRGADIYTHIHPFRMSEGYFPGLSRDDLGLGLRNDVMMIVMNPEQERYWWQDHRR